MFVLLLLAGGLACQSAFAVVTLPFYDGFPSSLTPDGGSLTNVDTIWTNTTAGFPNIIVATAYAQSYAGLQTPAAGSKGAHLWNSGSSSAAGVQINTTATSGSVYASFLIKVTTNTTGSRVIFEMNTSSAGAVSSPPFGVALNSDTTLSLFKTALIATKTPALALNTTYFVVVRYTFNSASSTDDTLDLWLNPDASNFGPSGTPPTATIAGVGSGNTDAASGFRTVNFGLMTSSTGAYDFDEVRAGISWADVTPIDIAAANYYRSRQSGDWSDYNTWDRSTDGVTFTPATSGQIPTSTDYVTNLVSHTVAVSSTAGAATLRIYGTLTVGAGSLTAPVVVVDGGTLDITTNASSVFGAVTLLNGGNINGTSGILSGTGYTMNAGTASANLGGASAALAVTGPVVLNGTNSYGGATTVSSGSLLKLGNGSALGATTAGTTVSSGGVLDLNGQSLGAEPLAIAGGGTAIAALTNSSATDASLAGLVTLTGNSYFGGTQNITLSGGVTQSSSTPRNLNKIGEGTLTLSGPSTYTGTNIIRAGTLRVSNSSALAGGPIATGFSTLDSSTLELASPGAYTNSSILLQGILHVTATSGAASLTFTNPCTMGGTGSRALDAGPDVTIYVNESLDLFGNTTSTNRNLNVQGAGSVVFNGSITNTDLSGIYLGGLRVLGTGTVTLNAANAYNGNTTIDGGTLILGTGGSIANSTNISIATDAIFDVSAAGFILGADQALGNNLNNTIAAGAGIIKGSVNASAGTVSLNYTNGACLVTSNGTLTLSAGTAFLIANANATPLPANSYKVIAKAGTGSVAGSVTTSPVVVSGGGASGTATLQITGGELYLVVASSAPPQLNVSQSGNALTFQWSEPGFKLQAQTNSISTGLTTNNWADYPGGGTSPVNVNIDPANPAVFFRLAQ